MTMQWRGSEKFDENFVRIKRKFPQMRSLFLTRTENVGDVKDSHCGKVSDALFGIYDDQMGGSTYKINTLMLK